MLSYKTEYCGADKDWIVFLHGLGGNSNIWYKQIEAFSGRFNLMFIDMFGHGDTRESRESYTFESLGRAVVSTMDHAGIESAHIVGISLGSIIADAVAFTAPQRVKSMVLGGAAMGYDLRARILLWLGSLIKGIIPYMWLYKLFAFIMMPRKNHGLSRKIFVREAKKLGGKEFKKWFRLMETLEIFYGKNASRFGKTPRLYISGEQDHFFLKFVVRAFLADPKAAIHVIDQCGHVCNIERADEFNRIALYYLTSYPCLPALKYVPLGRSGFHSSSRRHIPMEEKIPMHAAGFAACGNDRQKAA